MTLRSFFILVLYSLLCGFIHAADGIPETVPGNVTVRVRTVGKVPPKEYRRFWGCQDKGGNGYFGIQEVADPDGTPHITMFFHARARNAFLNFTHKRVPEPGKECVISVNVLSDRLVYYLDGAKIGELMTDRPIRTGDFGPYSFADGRKGIQIIERKVFQRALSSEEIRRLAQSGQELTAELKWYPSKCLMACAISMEVPQDSKEYPNIRIFNENNLLVRDIRLPSTPQAVVKTSGENPMLVIHDKVSLLDYDGSRLPEGRYRAELCSGKTGLCVVAKEFVVKEYEWFNTDVGKADVLLPGFSAVQVEGNVVSVVGRRYLFGASGLPEEIWTLGRQILARPITLDGVEAQATAQLKIKASSDTHANFSGSLASGRVEQDGLIVLELDVPPGEGEVSLSIPIRSEYGELFHACGVGIRTNPAGFLPKGTGRIFGSRAVQQTNNTDFIPYCWIGTDDRGVCYAADNDRGWRHGPDKDAVEIFREEDGTVVMRLNLICGVEERNGRKITVALQASPAKPMPGGWRGWVDGYDVPAQRNTVCNCSNPTWGCYIVGMARYPTFMDWVFVRKMAEAAKTGEVDDDYVERWIRRCMRARSERPELVPWLAKKSAVEAEKTLRAHAFAAFRRLVHLHDKKKRVVYYYTCDADPCEGLYELPVMADEWGTYTSVYGSHADYAVFYLRKMCENGMDGVYNDNAFFRCNYDWVTGNAWIDDEGEVHPSFSLWALRDFCRREILAMLEAGIKEPWLTIHNTNANILPALSYATNTMGMEWKYGNSEFQERFAPDYIRAVNQGLQGGFFPTVLEGIFDVKAPQEKTHLTRTMLAMLMPLEVQPTLQQSGDHNLVRKILGIKQEFGVWKDDCVYTAYYNEGNPVTQSRDDVMVSTYRRGAEMLLVIGSLAKEDMEFEVGLKSGRIIRAVNAENSETLRIDAQGKALVSIPRREFAIVRLLVENDPK